ncbi:MAG: T9SS type A sorting domain-containing protein, partial [Ferruginibacter sp.]
VRFAPTTNGVKNAIVTVVNDDIDEAAYSYAIQGTAFTILPVTVLSFKAVATGKITKLFWETATEINNAGFEIQRSIDGNTRWETIGFVKATNFANGSKYSFNDLAPLRGLNAYRLKQIDIDGRFTNSNTELVNFSGDATIISISPNPAKDKLNVIFNDKKLLNTQAKIRSASGALVATVTLNNYHQPIDISNLPGGLYFITFFDGSVQRIIKQ